MFVALYCRRKIMVFHSGTEGDDLGGVLAENPQVPLTLYVQTRPSKCQVQPVSSSPGIPGKATRLQGLQ
jgi:hypothetical protein